MAALASAPEATAMHVVPTVAITALRGGACRDAAMVAVSAGHVLVTTGQRKTSACMIEQPAIPAVRVVTSGAIAAESALVDVPRRMAVDAAARGFVEDLRDMALLAGHRGMQADQREDGQAMIEEDVLAPLLLVMATGAIAAERTLVRVVLGMAGIAGRLQLDICGRASVASITGNLGVSPL